MLCFSLQQLPSSTKTFVEATSCKWMYPLYWVIAAAIYRIILFIALLLMTFQNSKIITYFRKEGEIASLIMGFISFVASLVVTCNFMINSSTTTVKDETITKKIVSIIAIIVIFVLAVFYLPKVSKC